MLTSIAALLVVAAADAGHAERSIDEIVKETQVTVCKSKGRACDSFTAFLHGKPASAAKPVLTIGPADLLSIRGHDVTTEEGLVLSIKGPEASVFRITPDNEQEKTQLMAFVSAFAAGKPDTKSELFAMIQQGAQSQPHFKTELKDKSLTFQLNRPLGGTWIRSVGKKLYVVGFTGSLESPAVFAAELRDPR